MLASAAGKELVNEDLGGMAVGASRAVSRPPQLAAKS